MLKRRAALRQSSERPAKKQKTQLSMTQTIVKRELAKQADLLYADTAYTATNVLNTATITSALVSVSRGDAGLNDFSGNVIQPRGWSFNYFVHSSQVRNCIRIMMFQWFNTTTPVLSDILQVTTSGLAIVAPKNIANKSLFKILYDRKFQIAPTAGGDTTVTGEATLEPQSVYIPGSRLRKVRYQPGADIVQYGNLYLLLLSDDAVIPSPQLTGWSRVTYTD